MMRCIRLALLLALATYCGGTAHAYFPEDFESPLQSIAFGSCNRENLPQPLWPVITQNAPDLWIWMGDNIYGDSKKAKVIAAKYDKQFHLPGYTAFRKRFPIIGTWDDHDYGLNNAGAEYPIKAITRDLALDFMEVPANDPRRQREGLYGSYEFGPANQQVKVLLLDGRYFAVHSKKAGADLLGPAQQQWLEQELTKSKAQVHIIVSGIQVLASEHKHEKWANFPESRKWLLGLIEQKKIPGVILLSGDRHIHEISVLKPKELDYPLVEITSSGLSHSFTKFRSEPNALRSGQVHSGKGFGLMSFDWSGKKPIVHAEIKDSANRTVNCYTIRF